MLGDVNGNETIDIMDATKIQMFLAEIVTDIDSFVADVDGDEHVAVVDATYIQMYLAEIDVDYSIGELVTKPAA